jgi:hypothetical protein
MVKRIFVLILFLLINCININASENSDLKISNKYFSFVMPEDTKGTYVVDKVDNGIYVCEKYSAALEIGGFAFGVKMFRHPKDYADIPGSKKLGELKDKKGILYDVVLMRPSEIQYEDTKEVQKNYNRLYDFGNNVEIKGINGNKYYKNQGMKGKDLYSDILKKYKKAIKEKWDSKKFEQEKLGYMYPVLSKTNEDLLNTIGYAYYDINSDGIDELLIGKEYNIYDIYTMVERRPKHVVSGGDVDKYYIYGEAYLSNEYSSSKNENKVQIYILEKNSTELIPTIAYIKEGKDRYFVYGHSDVREKVSKRLFKRDTKMLKYIKPDFIPLGKIE